MQNPNAISVEGEERNRQREFRHAELSARRGTALTGGKMPTLLFSCWSSIWMSVSLALSSSLAACRAARASGLSPLARLLEPLLAMVREARPRCSPLAALHLPGPAEGQRHRPGGTSAQHGPAGGWEPRPGLQPQLCWAGKLL